MNTQGLEVNIEYNKFDIVNKQLILIYDIKLVNFSDKNVSKQELETKIKEQTNNFLGIKREKEEKMKEQGRR